MPETLFNTEKDQVRRGGVGKGKRKKRNINTYRWMPT